ncbi:MAG: dienelactone hydrolase family protein [Pseudobdellovibrionaceae bacterium]
MCRLLTLVSFLFSLSAMAAIKSETVEYKEGQTTLEGYMAHNPAVRMRQPAVVIVHAWMGVDDFVKKKTDEMAQMGFVALAADIYGKGVRPKDAKEAAELAGKYRNNDRTLLRARAQAAFDLLKKNPKVDPSKIVAIGYCFGGTTVLEMAMAGLPLAGVVSFHGGLEFPKLADTKNIKSKLLILHGAVDPYVPPAQVQALTKALDEAKTDYQFVAYSGAVHSFTDPSAGTDASKGAAYNPVADRRSTEAMKDFFREVVGAPSVQN